LLDQVETGFNFNVDFKLAMKAKMLSGDDGKIALLDGVVSKVVNPNLKIKLIEKQKQYLIRGIVGLKKMVSKSSKSEDRSLYTKLVNRAYGDGKTVLAEQDKDGVKFKLLEKKGELKDLQAQIGTGFYFDLAFSNVNKAKLLKDKLVLFTDLSKKIIGNVYLSDAQANNFLRGIVGIRKKLNKEEPAAPVQNQYGSLVTLVFNNGVGPIAKKDIDGLTYKKVGLPTKNRLKDLSLELASGFNFDAWYGKAKRKTSSWNVTKKFSHMIPIFTQMTSRMTASNSSDQIKKFLKSVSWKKFRTGYSGFSESQRKLYLELLKGIKKNPALYNVKLKKYKKRVDSAYMIFSTGFDFESELDKAEKRAATLAKLAPKINANNTIEDQREDFLKAVSKLYRKAIPTKAEKGKKVVAGTKKREIKALVDAAFKNPVLSSLAAKKFGSWMCKRSLNEMRTKLALVKTQ